VTGEILGGEPAVAPPASPRPDPVGADEPAEAEGG